MKVSIILPTYNRLTVLRPAIESVFAQSFDDWELIVIDDGSTDGTAEYIEGLNDPRARVIRVPHIGFPGALRNAAAKYATGKYLAFLDSDDLWHPSKLEQQLAHLGGEPNVRWSYTYVDWIGREGEPRDLDTRRQRQAIGGWIFQDLLNRRAWIALPAVMMERSLFAESGGFDETLQFTSDYEYWLRISRLSQVAVLPKALTTVRLHDDNTWRRFSETPLNCWIRVYGRLVDETPHQAWRKDALRMLARAKTYLADRRRTEHRYVGAYRALASALPTGITARWWWSSLAKTAVYPVVPAAVRSWYRRRHPFVG